MNFKSLNKIMKTSLLYTNANTYHLLSFCGETEHYITKLYFNKI